MPVGYMPVGYTFRSVSNEYLKVSSDAMFMRTVYKDASNVFFLDNITPNFFLAIQCDRNTKSTNKFKT